MEFHDIGKTIFYLGLALVIIGALLHFCSGIFPLGHLPGDFHWQGEHTSVDFPFMTCIVLSVVLTILANLFFHS